jgi:RNA polymerase sigma factor (TIGR02999 family)
LTSGKPPSHDPGELSKARYAELRRLARAYMSRELPGQTLQGTALVHEAYLKLLRSNPVWTDERHFFGIMANAMKQILIERARARGAEKRWAGLNRVTLSETLVGASQEDAMLPLLNDALSRLERLDPEQARIVELRYFVGLSNEDTADAIGVSVATVKRRWALARAWLYRELKNS